MAYVNSGGATLNLLHCSTWHFLKTSPPWQQLCSVFYFFSYLPYCPCLPPTPKTPASLPAAVPSLLAPLVWKWPISHLQQFLHEWMKQRVVKAFNYIHQNADPINLHVKLYWNRNHIILRGARGFLLIRMLYTEGFIKNNGKSHSN